MLLTKGEKDKMAKEFDMEQHWIQSFYMYESDFKTLSEWKMLTSIGKAGSSDASCFHEIAKERQDAYMIRIAKRVHEEFKTAVDCYVAQSRVDMKVKIEPVEYLGAMKHHRRIKFSFISFEPKASEGDFCKSFISTIQAYNEDSSKDFSDAKHKSGPWHILRQRTVKIQAVIEIHSFHFGDVKELLQQI